MNETTPIETAGTTTKGTELTIALAHFIGTEAYHKFSILFSLKLTDGVKYLCEEARAYWLMDIIASYQKKCMRDDMLRDFQVWTLRVEDGAGVVICERDTGDIAIKQTIPYTDFPMDEIKLYCINGVILLTSEY